MARAKKRGKLKFRNGPILGAKKKRARKTVVKRKKKAVAPLIEAFRGGPLFGGTKLVSEETVAFRGGTVFGDTKKA